MSPFKAGVLAILVLVAGTYFGFTKVNPFANPYELTASFKQAANIKPRSPVRIAGVNVGEVTQVKPLKGGGAQVKMKVKKAGLPIHTDARMKIRPRIFLEGNFFVEVQPGSPSAPTLESGENIPATQTAAPVQFADVLAALQTDTREDLKILLREYSAAIDGKGGDGFNRSIRYWEPAYKNTALVNEATLGTVPGDLQRVLRGQARVSRALTRDPEALKDLITDFNTTAFAFAREDVALKRSIPLLDETLERGMPALAALNSSLPSLRAFARDALPGTRSTGPTIDAALPFLRQANRLFSQRELRGLTRDLRKTVPDLVGLQRGQVGFQEENRTLSSCTNNVLLPFAKTPIPDPDFPQNSGQPFFKQAPRGLPGLAGESRIADANSPQVRAQFGGNATTFVSRGDNGEALFGMNNTPITGARPARPNARPVFRPGTPCETQETPDLNAPGGGSQAPTSVKVSPDSKNPKLLELADKARARRVDYADFLKDVKAGKPTIDPAEFNDLGVELQARARDLVQLEDVYSFRKRKKGEKVEKIDLDEAGKDSK